MRLKTSELNSQKPHRCYIEAAKNRVPMKMPSCAIESSSTVSLKRLHRFTKVSS